MVAIEQSAQQQSSKQKNHPLAPLVVTTGEPAGIGMDIVLQLASQNAFAELNRRIIVLADEQALLERASQIYNSDYNGVDDLYCGVDSSLWQVIGQANDWLNTETDHPNDMDNSDNKKIESALQAKMTLYPDARFFVIHTPCASPVIASELNVANAEMVMTQLRLAHYLAANNIASGIVTAPIQKSILIDAGLTLADGTMFTGHTEFFMQQSGRDKVVMMLANTAMKVALVTIHLPLREVADAITPDNVRQTVQIVLNDLTQKFGLANPKILVCGLNPHAGEGGHLGREEIEIINPVLQEFQNRGVNISSAMPADTLFTTRHLQDCDAVIAMYHDQGLPVLKSHGFGDTVNLTLGLPYIRTSVDHGTALDLAGKEASCGASSSSLWQALSMADKMAGSVTLKKA